MYVKNSQKERLRSTVRVCRGGGNRDGYRRRGSTGNLAEAIGTES